MGGSVLWLRRDLRVRDHPALRAAAHEGPLTALFVLDDALRGPSGAPRLAFLYRSLRSLRADLEAHGGRLTIRHGRPAEVVPQVVREVGADAVRVTADFNPYGSRRDAEVEAALGAVPLLRTGSAYAADPGSVVKDDGEPFKVYGAYYRAWRARGPGDPVRMQLGRTRWADPIDSLDVPDDPPLELDELPEAGEDAALRTWHRFRDERLPDYDDARNRPDRNGTSRLSVYLKYGLIHPRTVLADLGPTHEGFRKELAWREFYATVLSAWPASARQNYLPKMSAMPTDTGAVADEHFRAWAEGRTGYPIVDAGMRQLLGAGWMHNRLRMITASFLCKDLHLDWRRGARHFLHHLVDGDLASNNHGWQWVAGTGTDPSPFFRIFNPVTQGEKFDPDGEYVRTYVPELRGVAGRKVHRPWDLDPPPAGYPERIVDHAEERARALADYERIRS